MTIAHPTPVKATTKFPPWLLPSFTLLLSLMGVIVPLQAIALSWSRVYVDTTGRTGLWTSLRLDSAGNPHISYWDSTRCVLRYATESGSSWTLETVDSAGCVGLYTSLALTSNDEPRISSYGSWVDNAVCGCIRYSARTSGSWSTATIASGYRSSLVLDSSDIPHIAIVDTLTDSIRYAYTSDGTWTIEDVAATYDTTAPGGIGWFPTISIDLDSSGNPAIVYEGWDSTNTSFTLWYASRETGGSWNIQQLQYGSQPSLRFSGLIPHIAYQTNSGLEHAYLADTGWVYEQVVASLPIPVLPSIAIGTDGAPRIAYMAVGSSTTALRYAWPITGGWSTESVDAEDGQSGDYPSLAVTSDNFPRISFFSIFGGNLKYAAGSSSGSGGGGCPGCHHGGAPEAVQAADLEDRSTLPLELGPIAPNPVTSAGDLAITMTTTAADEVDLSLYDILGRLVRHHSAVVVPTAGRHVIQWKVPGLQPGLYTMRAKGRRGDIATRKLVVRN